MFIGAVPDREWFFYAENIKFSQESQDFRYLR